MTLQEKVISVAQSYIGKTEKAGNSGFNDPAFELNMKEVGFVKGQSWCAYFAELVWKEALKDHSLYGSLDKLFSASAVATAANFKNSALFKTGTTPKVGAVVIWRHGKGWQGHAGVVETVGKDSFNSIEGNTNAAGGREGIEVARKTRKHPDSFKANGLNIVCFIYLPE